ncbi:hypothetical protein [Rathayibacter toxicus]|uniref:hypothetical protein n=1 Tax=Rathayibacter toxicus TaxID=145458 RepID=UPI000CE7682B|nr:hypothetical protein [Rathayibacter toxicus]PPI53920.1 hypothetical protein C5D35_08540 [Rathayibacter toxicus]QOD10938.1 hypothetical protein BSG36_02955 [Rathayibacter toxicus]
MKNTFRRRIFASILLGSLVAVGSLAVASPAQAITIGVCTMQAQDPHPSTHVNGTINGVGTATCSVSMDEIYVHTVLERADGATWQGDTNDYFGVNREQSNAATTCNNGPAVFRLRLSYVLRAPSGYSPAYSANTVYSIWKSVACGVSNAVTPVDIHTQLEDELPAITETVTFHPTQ